MLCDTWLTLIGRSLLQLCFGMCDVSPGRLLSRRHAPSLMLDTFVASRRSIPQQQDSAWQTAAVRTRAPPGGVPASYPQQKLPIL